GADVNGPSGKDGDTPLMHALSAASSPGSPAATVVELLLQEGADVAAANRFGTRALHKAAWFGASVDTVRLLLNAGASEHVDAQNDHGLTPRKLAANRGHDDIVALFREISS